MLPYVASIQFILPVSVRAEIFSDTNELGLEVSFWICQNFTLANSTKSTGCVPQCTELPPLFVLKQQPTSVIPLRIV